MVFRNALTVGVMTAALVCGAAAQGKLDPFDYHASNIRLLMRKEIQTEIGITDAQRARMNKSAEAHDKRLAGYNDKLKASGKRPTPNDPEFLKLMDMLKQNVMAALTPTQAKRLRELSLQQIGLVAILDDQVAKKLALSESQLKQLRDLYTTGSKQANDLIQKEMRAALASYEGVKPKDEADKKRIEAEAQKKISETEKRIAPEVNKIRTGTRDKMLAVLSQTQKDKFKALQGKPFNGAA